MKITPINTLITFMKKKPENKEVVKEPTFKGFPPHRIHHIPTGGELGPRRKPNAGDVIYRHIDMLGNVIDIKA